MDPKGQVKKTSKEAEGQVVPPLEGSQEQVEETPVGVYPCEYSGEDFSADSWFSF